MYSRPEQLLEQYPLIVKSFSKVRECYLCDTSLGTVALHEYYGSKERAAFLAKMLRYLREKGLLVECIIESSEGEILVTDEEERKYLLTESYHGAECDVNREEDMLAATQLLADFHRISRQFPEEIPEIIRRNHNSLPDLYEKHNRELRQVRNFVRSRKRKNAFEELFIRQYETFSRKADTVTKALQSMSLTEEIYGFCHGDYNQHSIIFARQGIALVGLERFTYDLQIRDLANFVRKMMEKNNWDIELGMKLITAYVKKRPLQEEESRCLYFFLSYPEKFWKLANHYGNGHKSWLYERNVEKLEKVILQEKERELFLEELQKSLFSFHFQENQLY